MISKIKSIIQSSIDLKTKVLNDPELIETVQNVADQIIHCYENGGKVLFCGNGGQDPACGDHYGRRDRETSFRVSWLGRGLRACDADLGHPWNTPREIRQA